MAYFSHLITGNGISQPLDSIYSIVVCMQEVQHICITPLDRISSLVSYTWYMIMIYSGIYFINRYWQMCPPPGEHWNHVWATKSRISWKCICMSPRKTHTGHYGVSTSWGNLKVHNHYFLPISGIFGILGLVGAHGAHRGEPAYGDKPHVPYFTTGSLWGEAACTVFYHREPMGRGRMYRILPPGADGRVQKHPIKLQF